MDIGINIDGNSYWDTGNIWANVINSFSVWGTYGTPWVPSSDLTFTSDGYPLESAGMDAVWEYPDGTYQLSYTGSGTFDFSALGKVTNLVASGNTTTADITITVPDGQDVWFGVDNINPANPLDNLQLMMPGSQPGQIFNNAFIQKLAPFSTLRFMDFGSTNGNPVVNWSDRTTQQDVVQTSSKGVSLENMIAMCNQSGKNGWFNIPVGATNDYITNMAELLHQTMAPTEKIYIEYSNELWNTAFPQYSTLLSMAQANPALTATDPIALVGQEDAYRTMQISQIFQQVFGTADSQVQIVFAGQAAWTHFAASGLQYIQTNYGSPSQYINDLAVGSYVTINGSQDVAGLTLDQLFADLNQYMTSDIIPWIQQSSQLAKQYNLPLVAYEGGQGLTSAYNSTGNQALMEQAQNDPRMGQIIDELMDAWQSAGGGLFNYFNLIGNDSIYGFWSLLQNVNQVGSVKWDALMREVLPLGDVNGDGVVNSQDLSIIIGDMGQSNMWYSEGDLNGDNIVNGDDLALFELGLAREGASQAVPEPGMGAIAVAIIPLLLRRKRAA
ncbi:MAG TPA: dockerin type I domain-containing protein [Tepidisphaeraceae bacterium]|jgi:hypothetical protein